MHLFSLTLLSECIPLFPGTPNDLQFVENWQWIVIPHHEINASYIFRIEYLASKLQNFDQDHGRKYKFSVKAYNRAGLSTVTSTLPYQMHSKALPTTGRVFHVPQSNIIQQHIEEIGYQKEDDIVCVKWQGFYHHNNELTFSIGLGTLKEINDVIPSTVVNNSGSYCFTGLTLSHLQKYFVNVQAYNVQGSISVTSYGIFIATENEVLELARVDDGLDCNIPFNILKKDLDLKQGQKVEVIISEEIPSFIYYTVGIKHDWKGDMNSLELSTLNDKLPTNSWYFSKQFFIQYFKVPISESNQTVVISAYNDKPVTYHWNQYMCKRPTRSSFNARTKSCLDI